MMLATPSLGILRDGFQDVLLRAITEGQFPSHTCGLGYATRAIINEIADRHPEANPDLIADAYDAFEREADGGGWRISGAPPNC